MGISRSCLVWSRCIVAERKTNQTQRALEIDPDSSRDFPVATSGKVHRRMGGEKKRGPSAWGTQCSGIPGFRDWASIPVGSLLKAGGHLSAHRRAERRQMALQTDANPPVCSMAGEEQKEGRSTLFCEIPCMNLFRATFFHTKSPIGVLG